jgi:hypothetical protein
MKNLLLILAVLLTFGSIAVAADVAISDEEIQQAIVQLNPDAYDVVQGPVRIVAAGKGAVNVQAVSRVAVQDRTLPAGSTLLPGEEILAGVVVNLGPGEIELIGGDGSSTTLAVAAAAAVRQDVGKCSVTCGAGFYACCKEVDSSASCKCRANGTPGADCTTGGPGATTCSIELE